MSIWCAGRVCSKSLFSDTVLSYMHMLAAWVWMDTHARIAIGHMRHASCDGGPIRTRDGRRVARSAAGSGLVTQTACMAANGTRRRGTTSSGSGRRVTLTAACGPVPCAPECAWLSLRVHRHE